MDVLETQNWVDPITACRVEVSVESYRTVIDGRREYKKGKNVGWTVDSKEYSIVELVNDIKYHYKWADYQEVEFWYEGEHKQPVKLSTDAELLLLLRASRKVFFDMKIVGEQPTNDTQLVLHAGAICDTEINLECLTLGEVSERVNEHAVIVDDQVDKGNELLEEPLYGHGPTVAGPAREEEEEREHYMIVCVDPDADEPIGADKEWRYFKKGKKKGPEKEAAQVLVQPIFRLPDNVIDHDPESVPSDEAIVIGESYVPITTYDRDDPKIVEGSTFVDKDSFLMIMKQFCIKNEFETKKIKHSDPDRYRAKCKIHVCNWSVYVKKLLGCDTFVVYVTLNYAFQFISINGRRLNFSFLLADCEHWSQA